MTVGALTSFLPRARHDNVPFSRYSAVSPGYSPVPVPWSPVNPGITLAAKFSRFLSVLRVQWHEDFEARSEISLPFWREGSPVRVVKVLAYLQEHNGVPPQAFSPVWCQLVLPVHLLFLAQLLGCGGGRSCPPVGISRGTRPPSGSSSRKAPSRSERLSSAPS